MTKDTKPKPLTAISETAARVSFAAAAAFLILLAVLHFIKPEFDPSWNMISQYEIGHDGWLMQLAFLFLALSCVTLVVAIHSHVWTIWGRIGLALLLMAAIGMTIAALNITDPITTPKAEMSAHGNMHGNGFLLGVPGLTIAAVLISLSLRRNAAWLSAQRVILWIAQLPWASLVAMIVTIMIMLPKNGGNFGPGVAVGLPNRLFIIACCVWLMTVAWHAIQLHRQPARRL